MKYFKLTASFVVVITLFFLSCNGFNKEAKTKDAVMVSELNKKFDEKTDEFKNLYFVPAADSTMAIPEPQTEKEEKQSPPKFVKPEPKEDWDKKIIKNATLKLELKNYKVYNEQIRKSVKQFGGYIATEEQTQTEYQIENVVTIKVPVDQFENAMNAIPGTDAKVMERKITSEDVTSEYVDIKSRLASRKQVLNKYLEFLRQSKNMEDMLQVQTEINEIQENIESAAGRAQYLSHAAAYSTIHLTYYQLTNGAKAPDNSSSFIYKLKEAFKNGVSWIGDVTIAFVSVWPLCLLALAGIILYKRFKRRTVKLV
jgi:Domain of unknown function (DUF4349)